METRARYILVGLFALVAIAAGFAFVYWLNSTSGLGKRDVYQIRFLGAVSGLQIGAAVQYNGIRVGEVTSLGSTATIQERSMRRSRSKGARRFARIQKSVSIFRA
ncbi:MAG: MlaD family protein [Methylovirgula sp.]